MKLSDERIEEIATEAVYKALDIIDQSTDGDSMRSSGACGDNLAYKLRHLIEACLKSEYGVGY